MVLHEWRKTTALSEHKRFSKLATTISCGRYTCLALSCMHDVVLAKVRVCYERVSACEVTVAPARRVMSHRGHKLTGDRHGDRVGHRQKAHHIAWHEGKPDTTSHGSALGTFPCSIHTQQPLRNLRNLQTSSRGFAAFKAKHFTRNTCWVGTV